MAVRLAFKRCTLAYSASHKYVESIDIFGNGPESRHYWYELAERYYLWYYNFFMYFTWQELFNGNPPPWCRFRDFTGAMVMSAPGGDPDQNYQDSEDWYCWKQYDFWGGIWSENRIFLQKDDTYPTNRFSRFSLYCAGNEPAYIDVYGIPFNPDMSKITWNNMPNLGPLIGTYLIPNDGTWQNFLTYKQGTYNLLTSSIWRTICLVVNRPFYVPPWHAIAGLNTKSKDAPVNKRPYLTP